MPATVRRTSRTGLPGPRSEISFRWTPEAIKKLLKLIKDKPECRVTFFPTGLIQHYTKSGLARGLLLEMVKKEPEYLDWLKSEGMIKKDEEGKWIPRDAWTSTSITNPVITQMASLKRKFDLARKENKIQPEWTSFDDLPSRIRGDFKMNYPWYFQYKELASPSQSYERPPIRPRADRPHPVRDSTTPAPAPSVARSRQRLPPSPSPSDRSSSASSSSSSPSPSPSRSPSPAPSPSPPHVASLLPISLTPRENLDVQRSSSVSVALSGPRPPFRQNAVASSSRIPIKVEPSPSPSSASPASDIHRWGESHSGSRADTESEHEMENDTPTIRGSVAPHQLPASVIHAGSGKRRREFSSTPQPKRHKDHREVTDVEHESEKSADPSSVRISISTPRVESGIDPGDFKQSESATPNPSADNDHPISSAGNGDGDIEMLSLEDDVQQHAVDGRRNERRDQGMKRLRDAAAIHAPASIEDVPKRDRTREEYLAAETDDAKLEPFHRHCVVECRNALKFLQKHGLLPQCLENCRVWFDSVSEKRYGGWRGLATSAGATLCRDERELSQGSRNQIRIHVRVDLPGLAVEPNYLQWDGRLPYRAHQYSYMAFARFYYNRICRFIDCDYELLPSLRMVVVHSTPDSNDASSGSISSSQKRPATVRMTPDAALAQIEHADALVATELVEDTPKSEMTPKARAKSMSRLHAAVTPDLTVSMKAELLACCNRPHRCLYHDTIEQDTEGTAQWDAQTHVARSIIGTLKTHDMLSDCLAGCIVWLASPSKKKARDTMRAHCRAAGAIWCLDEAGLAGGHASMTRCQVNLDLPGFKTMPDATIESESGVITIRHFSLLAFYRFLYQRLLRRQGD